MLAERTALSTVTLHSPVTITTGEFHVRMRKTRAKLVVLLLEITVLRAREPNSQKPLSGMTAIFKTFLGAPGPENQPSGEEIIAKLKTR